MDRTLYKHGQKVNTNRQRNVQIVDILHFASRFHAILVRTAQHEGRDCEEHMSAAASTQAALRGGALITGSQCVRAAGLLRIQRALGNEELPDSPAFAAKFQASNVWITLTKCGYTNELDLYNMYTSCAG